MNTRVVAGCAIVLASSLALYAWLRPNPRSAAVERTPEPALDQHQLAPAPAAPSPPPAIYRWAEPSSTVETKAQPHPITAARAAIAEQSALFLEIERALSVRDVARAKLLIKKHERQMPDFDGGAESRQGYEAMARCIESPGAESRANGERFVLDHRASPLRRKVRHACLGPRAPVKLPPA
jgi:hypothetical protein